MHWAPSGTAMIASGARAAMLVIWAVGGAWSVASMVSWPTTSMPNSPAISLNASTYTWPNSLFTLNSATLAPSGCCSRMFAAYTFDSMV